MDETNYLDNYQPSDYITILNYGSNWNEGGFKCVSQKIGLTCTNSNGIGFFLSREKWRVLGLSRP